MEELTVEQMLEKYPYMKNDSKYLLYTTQKDFKQLRDGEKVKVDSKEVSIEFLKRVLNNDFYFEYASRYFTNEIDRFEVGFIMYGDLGGTIYYEKPTIIRGIEKLIESGQIELEKFEQERYESLKNHISFEKFVEKHKGNHYNIEIDNNKYSIPVEKLISLMQLPDEQFDDLCSNKEIKKLNGIPKEHLIYAAYKFFKETNAIKNFLLPETMVTRYKEIECSKKIDIEAINKHLTTEDTKYKNIQINNDLRQAILTGIPENATELEKAIYIYIKMCKLLTYDDEYYAVNQKGEATTKHKSTDYVSSITLENNKVVCFEFNLIYSKMLNELGINFSSDYKGMIGEAYGEGHANLEFRYDKFLVSADSVTSILQGDLVRAKGNQVLVGLTCLNKNEQTQSEFNNSMRKMYQLIIEQEKSLRESKESESSITMEELLKEYSDTTNNIKDVSLHERISILIDKLNSTGVSGIDSLAYVLQLRKILFDEEQRENNVKVTIVRNNEPIEEGRIAMASAIFTLNNEGFEANPEQNIYLLYTPNNKLSSISKEDLQTKFNDGTLSYIEQDDPKIPGIVENKGVKK